MAKRSGEKTPAGGEGPIALPTVLRALLIILAGLWIYLPALHGGWLWDDDYLVSENAVVQAPNGLWTVWFHPTSLVDYFPLTVTVEWIEWHLFGSDTLGYHVVSLVLHLTGALLVWRLLARFSLRWAWLGGLIFAVHPIVVESVAWMAELKNTLSLIPFLLAMIFWIDFEERRRTQDYLLSLVLFLVAMLCKTSMVMFPVVILLYAWWKRGRIGGKDLAAAVPFFVVSLVLGLVTILFLLHQEPAHDAVQIGGPLSRLACAGLSIAFYFSKCVLPIGLMPVYPRWAVDPPSLVQFLPWPVLAGILFYLWKKRHGWGRHALLGLGFFLILLLPFCGLIAGSYMRFSWVMDHIVYLPLIGIIGLGIAALESLQQRFPAHPRFVPIVVGIIIMAAALSSHGYAEKYTDRATYWTFALQQNPDASSAHNNLGNELEKSGSYSEALKQFNLAVQDDPDYVEALSNRGQARMFLADPAGALTDLDRAITLDPDNASSFLSRGVLKLSQGDAPAALSDLAMFHLITPKAGQADYAQLWIWIALNQLGKKAEADRKLSADLSRNWNAAPGDWPSQNARFLLGQISETDYLAAAVSSDEEKNRDQHCEAWFYLGEKRAFAGNKVDADTAFRACIATGKTDFYEYMLAKSQIQSDKLHQLENYLTPSH